MKKYFLFIAIIGISIIAIFSCRKSFDPETNPTQVMTPSSETELKIQSFLNRLQSNLKDETTYSIEDAIWYSTAVMNYTYAIYDSSFLYTKVDTSTFSVGLDKDGKVTESDLEDLIETMTDSLEAFFEDLPVNTKHVMLCMAYETNSTEESLDLGLVSVVGYGFSSTYYGSFGPTDYWYAIWNQGDCYDFTRPGDATIQLKNKLLHPLVENDPDWRIYTIPGSDYVTDQIDPLDYPYPSAPRGHRGYCFGGTGNWDGPQCLPPNEMNFYISANGIPYIIEDNKPLDEDYEFTYIEIEGDVAFPPGGYYETHFFWITYSILYHTSQPASSL